MESDVILISADDYMGDIPRELLVHSPLWCDVYDEPVVVKDGLCSCGADLDPDYPVLS